MVNLILCYHRVSDKDSGGMSLLSIKTSDFRWQLNYLKNKFGISTLEDCVAGNKKKSISITFDDGYADNSLTVAPLLSAENIPATFFVTSDYIDTNLLFLPDLLDVAFSTKASREKLQLFLKQHLSISMPKLASYWSILDLVRNLPHYEFMKIIRVLSEEFGSLVIASDAHRRPMNRQELLNISENPLFSIGGHTRTHRRLSDLNPSDFSEEILGGLSMLKKFGIDPSKCYAIPFGAQADYTPVQVSFFHNNGLVPLSTAPLGFRSKQHPNVMPRLCIQAWGKTKFRMIIRFVIIGSYFPKIWLSVLDFRRSVFRPKNLKSLSPR